MPQTSSASDVLGIGTLVLVLICICAGAVCLAYVLLFHFRVGKERQPLLRDFDSPWLVRVVLICLFILWTLGELLRLPWLREKDRVLHSVGLRSQGNLCRFHVVWSVGVMEPGLLLTVLFLVQSSLQEVPRHFNGRVLFLMIVSCLPVFVLQLAVAVAGHGPKSEGSGGIFSSYFTRSYEVLQNGSESELALCSYPLLSVLALGLFSMVFVFCFARLGYRMLCHVINRRLRLRVYWLMTTVLLLVPLHVILLGVTVRLDLDMTAHEILMFLGFLTLLLCASTAMGVLVVLPVADAISVHYLFRSRDQSSQNFSASPVEAFGRSTSTGFSDNDDLPNNVGRNRLLGGFPSSSLVTDIGSSSRDGSITFDTPAKDLTLGPGGWLVNVPGFVASPPSPVLPGRPLTFL